MEQELTDKEYNCKDCDNRCGKLDVYDWIGDLPKTSNQTLIVEVQFKNTRKGYYKNSTQIVLEKGDIVAVEASPGHDVGVVTLVGDLVLLQMLKNGINPDTVELKRIYRKAKPVDVAKWNEARALERQTMLESRTLAQKLGLNMKIGDVEYQGDCTKAIFYYIADERVDFRELIKVLADKFKVRIEMRQIGARQEAGRIGGIGPCGRDLCCASWMTNFVSVTTNAARYQEISLNPQKLAGQCGKLKCCLNYELDVYMDAISDFPNTSIPLVAEEGNYQHIKTDVFKRLMWYGMNRDTTGVMLTVDKVKEIIELNKKGKKIGNLGGESVVIRETNEIVYQNIVGQESITRFDDKNKRKRTRGGKKHRAKQNRQNNESSNDKQ
ncbi:MAG: Signal peptidase-like protein [Cytophagaceae bacterium]|jgi:cell fate regulator YaaT (PSP1 superfamily)|nr:Signal peptidase-like protein [Cytophagaceae bacterium]